MPIRLTVGYGQRLAIERLEKGSQIRKDILTVCEFLNSLRKIDASNQLLVRAQFARIIQDEKSAVDRIFNENSLSNCTSLQLHEKFELSFLTAVLAACASAFESSLEKIPQKQATVKSESADNTKDAQAAARQLTEKLESLRNVQILFLIGSNPDEYIKPFFNEFAGVVLSILLEKLVVLEARYQYVPQFIEAASTHFSVWMTSGNAAASWIGEYLNYQHQNNWAAQVSDDVKSIQQALTAWVQPTSEAAKKRSEAWDRYKTSLLQLPDHKETMFAENFGVRRVFVQPIAQYKVAGMNLTNGATVPDVANLIAGLISERVPGDELILLCGGPGSGKSTLCRIIASELASNKEMHPVFLRLRRLQDGQDVPSFVEAQLQKEGIIDKFADLAEVSNLVLILDGFDELVMASRSRLREFFNTLREDLITGPLRNSKAIVSGRDTLFPNGAGLPTGSHVISLLSFDKSRIAVWGEKWRALHPSDRGNTFHPEDFFDEKSNNASSKAAPLHHLVSWPLTLHLVARVHDSGALDLTKGSQQKIEKAVLYKSIVAQTALRQQEQQGGGKGRLSTEQMREFVQAISWEMYSSARDSLDYSEGLPILKTVYPSASETELAELADVAIVNQPELTKGEQGGFEFVHKSFSEYFVAERFAHTIEKCCFKSQDYDSDKLTWRMSVKEAISELAALIAIRVVTPEVQEMCEPMLADFKVFLRSAHDEKVRASELLEKLVTKKSRFEELLAEYASGKFQVEVVDRVRGSKIVRNERDIHANFAVGLLIIACAICKRLIASRSKKAREGDAVFVDDSKLWKIISIIQSGDIQIDRALANRSLNPIRASSGEEKVEVPYPPIPPNLLEDVDGVRFPLSYSVARAVDVLARLMVQNQLLSLLMFRRERPGAEWRLQARYERGLSPISDGLFVAGVLPRRYDYVVRELDEFMYRLERLMMERGDFASIDPSQLRMLVQEILHRGPSGRNFLDSDFLHEIERVLFDRRTVD